MRRWLLVLMAVAVVASTVIYVRSRPLDVHVRDIHSVTIDPYPEGPPGPTFTRGARPSRELFLPFEQLESYVPDPLPNTAWQGVTCSLGGNLVVALEDGDSVRYGPCRRPESINGLWAHMFDISSDGACRPRCGPGGLPGP